MSDEKIFVDGMIVKRRDNAPDFVVASLSLKGAELVEFMRKHHRDGWCNIDIKRSKGGKLYAELDTWQPTQKDEYQQGTQQAKQAAVPEPAGGDFSDDIPFAPYGRGELV